MLKPKYKKWEKGGLRPKAKDEPKIKIATPSTGLTDEEVQEMIRIINEHSECSVIIPMEYKNRLILTSTYYFQECMLALLKEGYEVNVRQGRTEDEIVITWGDKI